MEAKPNAGDYFVFRTFASLNPTLLFVEKGNVEAISEQTTGNLLLIGQTNQWFRFKTSNDFKVFGITFSSIDMQKQNFIERMTKNKMTICFINFASENIF